MAYDWSSLAGLGNWVGDNGMGLLTAGSTAANLGGGIYSALAKAAEQRKLESLMKQGPNVGAYYQPMSEAEAAGFNRGAMSTYQQAVPPGGYLASLMGENMATRESQRYQDAQRMAYNDWTQRVGGRQFAAGQQPGMGGNIGAPLAQYMLWRQIQAARARAEQPPPGANYNPTAYGASVGSYTPAMRPGMTDLWQQGQNLYNPQVRTNVDALNISPGMTGFKDFGEGWDSSFSTGARD